MSDAKSRYEIVESLTDKRTKVINEIGQIKDSLNQREYNLKKLDIDQKREQERLVRKQKEEKEDELVKAEVFKKSVNENIKALEAKKEALTEAIEALKAISANNEKSN